MIVVTAHLVSANDGSVKELGRVLISNEGDRHPSQPYHNYQVQLMRKPDFKRTTKTTTLENWPRKRKTIWQMVQKALNQLYPN